MAQSGRLRIASSVSPLANAVLKMVSVGVDQTPARTVAWAISRTLASST